MDYRNAYRGDESTGASCRAAALRHVKRVLPPPPRPPRGVHFLGGLRCHSMERWIRKVAQPVDADDSIFTLRSGAVCGVQEQERKGKGTSGYQSQNERKQGGKDRNPKPVGSGPPLPLSPPRVFRDRNRCKTDPQFVRRRREKSDTLLYPWCGRVRARAANHVREPQLTSSLAPRPTCAPVTNDPNTS